MRQQEIYIVRLREGSPYNPEDKTRWTDLHIKVEGIDVLSLRLCCVSGANRSLYISEAIDVLEKAKENPLCPESKEDLEHVITTLRVCKS
jgi:hypothetical protein